jgi:hypothetical protein
VGRLALSTVVVEKEEEEEVVVKPVDRVVSMWGGMLGAKAGRVASLASSVVMMVGVGECVVDVLFRSVLLLGVLLGLLLLLVIVVVVVVAVVRGEE